MNSSLYYHPNSPAQYVNETHIYSLPKVVKHTETKAYLRGLQLVVKDHFFAADHVMQGRLMQLHALGIAIEPHMTATATSIESELTKMIGATSSRVFVVMHCSLEFAAILFEKARVLGLMEKGFVWIVAEEISNLLDSADSSLLLNMEGVLAIKSDYSTNHNNIKAFKSKFKRKYESSFPSEENPTRAFTPSAPTTPVSQKPVFHIVNVTGKSYRIVAVWSPELGFSGDQLRSIFWPGRERLFPRGWSLGAERGR
ncbi:uncharacterized protein LOC121762468 [Salvia splendens]|uniref:uncharacterized protein LOC121762468 n=1 Tax=Salvia splendens TaxID=180675 RepID=UPI001C253538|nr:uncharacterized protein LOC121762468 [Salvia splendens]